MAPGTKEAYRQATKHLLRWWSALLPALPPNHTLTAQCLAQFLVDLYRGGHGYSTANQVRSGLVLMYRTTTTIPRPNWITESPLVKAVLTAYERSATPGVRRFPLRGYILRALAIAFRQIYPPEWARVFIVALYLSYWCLLRSGEVTGITWGDALWAGIHLTLALGITKGDPTGSHPPYRTKAPLLIRLLAHQHTHLKPHPQARIVPCSPVTLNAALQRALTQVTYPIPPRTYLSWHSLRHGRALDLHDEGCKGIHLQRRGRWATHAASQLYLHFLASRHWPCQTALAWVEWE